MSDLTKASARYATANSADGYAESKVVAAFESGAVWEAKGWEQAVLALYGQLFLDTIKNKRKETKK